MNKSNTFVGNHPLKFSPKVVSGTFEIIDGEKFYKVGNYDMMPPFLMTIVSPSDHWMFISSSGGVTAGRQNSDHAIFPYYTDDKIHEATETSGSKIMIRVLQGDRWLLWEPFMPSPRGTYLVRRNLYKNVPGNKVIFEEENEDLGISCIISWMNSEKYGWLKKTALKNTGTRALKIEFLDALVNILPFGILKAVQEQFSTLMDAYKKGELDTVSGLGIFSMSSIPVDRAEPSESLKATTVWSTLENPDHVLLSTDQFDRFRFGSPITDEQEKKGIRGAYALVKEISLAPEASHLHIFAAETDQDSASVRDLSDLLKNSRPSIESIDKDIEAGTEKLISLVSEADGIQRGRDEANTSRHFSNVLFNIMRGGIYDEAYVVRKSALIAHARKTNKDTFERHQDWFSQLDEKGTYATLTEKVSETGDPDLQRMVIEYLPLTFSRRHGDPSRPWNRFSIDIKNPDGSRKLSYEGNWRDIFQNWEALSWSYPCYLEGIIAKFLNASTIDGYNPYRITSEGIDWETFDPENPWSFIGYWGDHQGIYLLKLLEMLEQFFPGKLEKMLEDRSFVFANVPYRIKPYEKILEDHQSTIDFDMSLHKTLLDRYDELGADGKLLTDPSGNIIHANMLDKLLVNILTKLSNFIPGAGIWMNTQRPEWNDANNALVGNGVSMVTLYYLRRFTTFLLKIIPTSGQDAYQISEQTHQFLTDLDAAFSQFSANTDFSGEERKQMMDRLGKAGSDYREKVYSAPSMKEKVTGKNELVSFLELANSFLDQTIANNRREDGLYHAYNLIEVNSRSTQIQRLPLMLEGQVAFLSSGVSDVTETVELLEALRKSPLYREDQQSYMLYPDKRLPAFMDKNIIPAGSESTYPVIEKIMNAGGLNILHRDQSGDYHFDGDLKNQKILAERIRQVNDTENVQFTDKEKEQLQTLYESLFNHRAFTGRSGSFFKYEGLGSIYWHMVSKLLLAVAENIRRFEAEETAQPSMNKLHAAYREIREGIGAHKNPAAYGAIPTDPYSHTPSMMGAQQPGMTGQVKEDIISRWFELGIDIKEGMVHIHTGRIDQDEINAKGELSFSFCGVPFVYAKGIENIVLMKTSSGEELTFPDCVIDQEHSSMIFSRSGEIEEVRITYREEKE